MPEKVLPSAEAFELFCQKMKELGFRELTRSEFPRDWWRLGLVAPSRRKGREVGFSFTARGLEARVWTTFLEAEGEAREEDAGWVLIKDGDRARYFTRPLSRTKYFLRRLYRWAEVARFRVLDRPLCSLCRARMRIGYGRGHKSRYWQCMRIERHSTGEPVWADWDIGLKERPKAFAFVQAERKKRKQYRDEMRAAGKEPGAALRRRRGWKVGRPENLE